MRFKKGEIDNERYYQIPKAFFTNPLYKSMSSDAKMIYAFLKDRMVLSGRNGWHDDNGDIYLYFSQEAIAEMMGISTSTVSRSMKQLQNCKLIEMVKQGQGKPSKIYINKLALLASNENHESQQDNQNENQENQKDNQDEDVKNKTCKNASQEFQNENQDLHQCNSRLAPMQTNETEYSETECNNNTPISPKGDSAVSENLPAEKPKSEKPNVQVERFTVFWQAYPKKVAKGAAERAWRKIKPSAELLQEMLAAIERGKVSKQWNKDNGQYIPNPSTWLNQKRWEDELEPMFVQRTAAPDEIIDDVPSLEDEMQKMWEDDYD